MSRRIERALSPSLKRTNIERPSSRIRKYLPALLVCCLLQGSCSHIKEESSPFVFWLPPILATAFIGDSAGWVITNKGDLLHTDDGGTSWHEIPGKTVGDFDNISFIDELHGWASSGEGEIWRTADGGEQWVLTARLNYFDESFGGGIEAMAFLNDTDGWLVCPFALWRTVDGGVTWKQYRPYGAIHETVAECKFFDRHRAWLADQGGGVYRSENGGKTWNKEDSAPKGVDWGGIYFHDDQKAWLSKKDGIYSTRDGGLTWQKQLANHLDLRLDSVQLIGEDEIWLSGLQKVSPKPQTDGENLENQKEEYESICLHSRP